MKIIVPALLSFLLAGGLPAETFNHARDGFAITVPAGWTEIAKADLDRITAEGRKALQAGKPSQAAQAPEFSHGYRAPDADAGFPPYVLVWIRKSGRVPEGQLKTVPKLDMASLAKEAREATGGLIQSLAINTTSYDESTHILWNTAEATYPGSGPIGILSGGVMTEEGIIQVYGYAPRERFEQTKPTLATIIGSVQPSEALRYKPRALDHFGGNGFSVTGFLTYAAIGAVAGLVAHLIKKKRAQPAA